MRHKSVATYTAYAWRYYMGKLPLVLALVYFSTYPGYRQIASNYRVSSTFLPDLNW